MTTNTLVKPTLRPNRLSSANPINREIITNRKLVKVVKSIDRLFNAVCCGLPQGNLIIEDMKVKGNRLIVRYQSPDSSTEELTDKAVAVHSLEVLDLSDGTVIEHKDLVYQVRTI